MTRRGANSRSPPSRRHSQTRSRRSPAKREVEDAASARDLSGAANSTPAEAAASGEAAPASTLDKAVTGAAPAGVAGASKDLLCTLRQLRASGDAEAEAELQRAAATLDELHSELGLLLRPRHSGDAHPQAARPIGVAIPGSDRTASSLSLSTSTAAPVTASTIASPSSAAANCSLSSSASRSAFALSLPCSPSLCPSSSSSPSLTLIRLVHASLPSSSAAPARPVESANLSPVPRHAAYASRPAPAALCCTLLLLAAGLAAATEPGENGAPHGAATAGDRAARVTVAQSASDASLSTGVSGSRPPRPPLTFDGHEHDVRATLRLSSSTLTAAQSTIALPRGAQGDALPPSPDVAADGVRGDRLVGRLGGWLRTSCDNLRRWLRSCGVAMPLAPAALMAAAAMVAGLLERIRLKVLAWAVPLSLCVLASAIAFAAAPISGGTNAGGAPPVFDVAAAIEATSHLARADNPHAAASLSSFLRNWESAVRRHSDGCGDGGGGAKLLLLGQRDGRRIDETLSAMLEKLPPAVLVLQLRLTRECGENCASRVEAHLVQASNEGRPALVLLREAERCTSDECFGDSVLVLEKLIEPNGSPHTLTQHGQVSTPLSAFLLVATPLEAQQCDGMLRESHDDAALQADLASQLESMWPADNFSREVRTARRAFVNRLGSRVSLLCG